MDVRMPDGKIVTNVPDGITQEELLSLYRGNNPDMPWSAVPGQALRNLPGSAGNFASGVVNAFRHPVDTATGLADVAAGSLRNAVPEGVRNFIDSLDANPEAAQRASNTSSAVVDAYKGRYGSMEGLKNTLATDPVGAMADASMLAGGGSAALKVAGLPKFAAAADVVSQATNPINLAVKATKGAAKLAGNTAASAIGTLTGTGMNTVKEAAKAGYAGKGAFIDNALKRVSPDEVVTQAREALGAVHSAGMDEYLSSMAKMKGANAPVKIDPVFEAFGESIKPLFTSGGNHTTVGANQLGVVKEVLDVLKEWKSDPSLHNAVGMDALKRRLDAVYPTGQDFGQAQRVVTQTRNAVKDAIVKASPDYADAMKAASSSISTEKEIANALSLGDGKSIDTALRKLQSLTRNNVNTNYGNRQALMEVLQSKSGADLMPALAGQAMSSPTPRGLAALGAGGAGLYALMSNPKALAALPLTSPLLMGLGAYGTGRVAGLPAKAGQFGLGLIEGATGKKVPKIPFDPEWLAQYGLLSSRLENQ